MADIIDEHGNPIQLTDQHGQQVKLTDEHGVPMHLTGVATTVHSSQNVGTTIGTEPKMQVGTHFSSAPNEPVVGAGGETMPGGEPVPCHPGMEGEKPQFGGVGSSSSSSSEDDGEGGRRKKKGLMQKIKDKLPGHKKKDQEQVPEKVYTATSKVTVTTPGGPLGEPKTERIHVEHHEEEHEKKGLMDKIMDKLPGHH